MPAHASDLCGRKAEAQVNNPIGLNVGAASENSRSRPSTAFRSLSGLFDWAASVTYLPSFGRTDDVGFDPMRGDNDNECKSVRLPKVWQARGALRRLPLLSGEPTTARAARPCFRSLGVQPAHANTQNRLYHLRRDQTYLISVNRNPVFESLPGRCRILDAPTGATPSVEQ